MAEASDPFAEIGMTNEQGEAASNFVLGIVVPQLALAGFRAGDLLQAPKENTGQIAGYIHRLVDIAAERAGVVGEQAQLALTYGLFAALYGDPAGLRMAEVAREAAAANNPAYLQGSLAAFGDIDNLERSLAQPELMTDTPMSLMLYLAGISAGPTREPTVPVRRTWLDRLRGMLSR